MYKWIYSFLLGVGYPDNIARRIALFSGVLVLLIVAYIVCKIKDKYLK